MIGIVKSWVVQSVLLCAVIACGKAATDDGSGRHSVTDETVSQLADASVPAVAALAEASADAAPMSRPDSAVDAADAAPSMFDADAQELFDYPHVPTFDFSLPEATWLQLQANARAEQYVEAECSFEGEVVGRVGLRFKGDYGSLLGCVDDQNKLTCPKLSLKVKFDEYVEDQRFFGLKRLNFNANHYDDSRLREKLSYELFRAMGIITPRVTWAVVRVNGESQGLYGLVEQVDGRFTKDRWPDTPDGNLYKEAWPGETNAGILAGALVTNEEVEDVSTFLAFSQALTTASSEDSIATLGGFMDLDKLTRYMAVDDAVANYDGVTYFWTNGSVHHNHNFYVYEEGPSRFNLIPWDVEASFWINPDHAAPHWTELQEDCELTYPYWEGLAGAPACDPLFHALNADLGAWRAASRELLDGPFALGVMLENIEHHVAFMGDEARADPTPSMYESFDSGVQDVRNSIAPLRARLESLIATN